MMVKEFIVGQFNSASKYYIDILGGYIVHKYDIPQLLGIYIDDYIKLIKSYGGDWTFDFGFVFTNKIDAERFAKLFKR